MIQVSTTQEKKRVYLHNCLQFLALYCSHIENIVLLVMFTNKFNVVSSFHL